MKLIIDIPEKTNAHIRSDYGHGVVGFRYDDEGILCHAVYHGTPYEERPHGEWIEKCTSFGGKCWAKCSVCNEFANGFGRDNGFGHDYFYPNFCPNCGADMREEGEAE